MCEQQILTFVRLMYSRKSSRRFCLVTRPNQFSFFIHSSFRLLGRVNISLVEACQSNTRLAKGLLIDTPGTLNRFKEHSRLSSAANFKQLSSNFRDCFRTSGPPHGPSSKAAPCFSLKSCQDESDCFHFEDI